MRTSAAAPASAWLMPCPGQGGETAAPPMSATHPHAMSDEHSSRQSRLLRRRAAAAIASRSRRRCHRRRLPSPLPTLQPATPANDARAAVERQHRCWCIVRWHVRARTGNGHAGAGSLRRAAGGSTQPTAQACVRLSGQSCACAHGHAPCHRSWAPCTLFAVCAHTAIVGAACR